MAALCQAVETDDLYTRGHRSGSGTDQEQARQDWATGSYRAFQHRDVRLEAARGLAEVDERSAAEAYRSIVADSSVGEDVRSEAVRGASRG